MRCEICDTEIPAGATECPHCGFEVAWMHNTSESDRAPKEERRSDYESRSRSNSQPPKARRVQNITARPDTEYYTERHGKKERSLIVPIIIALVAGILISGAGFFIYFRLAAKADGQNEESNLQESVVDRAADDISAEQMNNTNADGEIILLDDNGVTVYLTGEYESWGDRSADYYLSLDAIIINNSSYPIRVICDCWINNEWQLAGGAATSGTVIKPGKKTSDGFGILTDGTDVFELSDIESLELEVVAYDADTYEDVTGTFSTVIGFANNEIICLSGYAANNPQSSNATELEETAPKNEFVTTHDNLDPYLTGLRRGLGEDNSIGLSQEAFDGINSVQIFDKTGSVVFQTEFKDQDVSRMLGVQPTEKTETMKWVSDAAVSDEEYEHYIDLLCEYYGKDNFLDSWEDLEYYCSVEASHQDGKIQIKWLRQQYTPEEFAARLITSLAGLLPNPLSVEITGAWYSFDIGYNFTFQLTMDNSLGNSQTVYYGTPYAVDDLDDSTIEYNAQLDRDSISAMQEGIAMSADNIQDYFIMNYGRDK